MPGTSRAIFNRRKSQDGRRNSLTLLTDSRSYRSINPGFLPLPPIVSSPLFSPEHLIASSTTSEFQPITANSSDFFTSPPSSSSLPSAPLPDITGQTVPGWLTAPPTSKLIKRSVTSVSRKHALPLSTTTPIVSGAPTSKGRFARPRNHRRASSDPVLSLSDDMLADCPHARNKIWENAAYYAQNACHRTIDSRQGYSSSISSRNRSVTSTRSDVSHDSSPNYLRSAQSNGLDISEQRNFHAVMEIFTTEAGYLSDLQALVKVYLHNLQTLATRSTQFRPFNALSRAASSTTISEGHAGQPAVLTTNKERDIQSQSLLSAREMDILWRNAEDLLDLHQDFVAKLQVIADSFQLSLEEEPVYKEGIPMDSLTMAVTNLFASESPRFGIYEKFCARHQEALDIVRRLQQHHHAEWNDYERHCAAGVFGLLEIFKGRTTSNSSESPSPSRHRSRSITSTSLDGIRSLTSTEVPRQVSRLTFLDYMIKPIQRICKYPLMLERLRGSVTGEHSDQLSNLVQTATQSMRHVASAVDEARHKQDIIVQTSSIMSRISVALPMPRSSHLQPINRELRQLTPSFISSLGSCLMGGPLDVYKPPSNLQITIKAKYYGVFLYVGGYVIIVKVSKKIYDPKFWFKLDSITDNEDVILPNAFRVSSGAFQLELAASCQAEKDAWMAAIHEAHHANGLEWINEPIPSFKVHDKVDTFDTSALDDRGVDTPVVPADTSSAAMTPKPSSDIPALTEQLLAAFEADSRQRRRVESTSRPDSRAPSRRSSTASVKALFTPMISDSKSIIVQRASVGVRMHVDNGLQDVISEPCLNARLLANKEDDVSYTPRPKSASGSIRPKSASGSIRSTRSTRSRIYRNSETVRIPRSRSVAESDGGWHIVDAHKVPSTLTFTQMSDPPDSATTTFSSDTAAYASPISQYSTGERSETGSSTSSNNPPELVAHKEKVASARGNKGTSKSFMGSVKAMFLRDNGSGMTPANSAATVTLRGLEKPADSNGHRKSTILRKFMP